MIRVELQDGIETITLDGPKRNALSLEMMRQLSAALHAVQGRAVVLAATGPVFCSGHDLTELTGCDSESAATLFTACEELMRLVQTIPAPVIAQVQGPATAAGCQLVATCDLAIAADTAWFATPGVKIGLFCSTPMVALTRAIGRKHAMEMLLTAKQIDAPTAASWGLINHAVPAGDLHQTVRGLAQSIVQAAPSTLATGKRAFYQQIDLPRDEAYALMSQTMVRNALSGEAQQSMRAFLDRRKVG